MCQYPSSFPSSSPLPSFYFCIYLYFYTCIRICYVLATNKENLSVSKGSFCIYTHTQHIYIYIANDGITMDSEGHRCTKSHTFTITINRYITIQNNRYNSTIDDNDLVCLFPSSLPFPSPFIFSAFGYYSRRETRARNDVFFFFFCFSWKTFVKS